MRRLGGSTWRTTGVKKSSEFESGGETAMDRYTRGGFESEMAMRSSGHFPLELVLPGRRDDIGGYCPDEPDRRAVHEGAVLRQPADGPLLGADGIPGESE